MSVSAQALWAQLTAAGLTLGEAPPAEGTTAPWFVRLMLCIAGLIAAAFLLGFVGVGFAFIVENRAVAATAGLALIAGAFVLFRSAPRNDFASMFALAVSFAGQALFIYGLFALFERGAGAVAWSAVAAVEIVLAIVMPNFIHRVTSAYGAGIAVMYALVAAGAGFLASALAALVAYLWLNERRHCTRRATFGPIAYGATLALLHIEAMPVLGREWMALPGVHVVSPWGAPWMGETLAAAALLATLAVLVRRAGWVLSEPRAMLAIAAGAAVCAASFKAPGVAAGLMIVLLAFANGNRVLLGLGIAGLLFYVSAYYYLVETTLLAKAAVLAATGAILLIARTLVLRFVLRDEPRA